jgi:putative nucleotidyltransferase with HDIG domain
MTAALVEKLNSVRDLKRILEATVREVTDSLQAECCQIILGHPLDPNSSTICEYRAHLHEDDSSSITTFTLPLVLSGNSFGSMSVIKRDRFSESETNSLRILLGELSSIIRQAQMNDAAQRDTFRETFLFEIKNVMAYSLGIGDALFMVVNILGKVLQTSRCLFICTDDAQAGWKCYEFSQQDKVKSCNDFHWPTADSPVVAQTLLSTGPLQFYEGQENSYVSPVQEEMKLIDVRSLLGVPLQTELGVHGCVILQQCDYRRAWTASEIDMVQNVADKVAEALVKLPAEKKAREPIMQLHQRIVSQTSTEPGPTSMQSVRAALKVVLGQQVIPIAKSTTDKPLPVVPIKSKEKQRSPASSEESPTLKPNMVAARRSLSGLAAEIQELKAARANAPSVSAIPDLAERANAAILSPTEFEKQNRETKTTGDNDSDLSEKVPDEVNNIRQAEASSPHIVPIEGERNRNPEAGSASSTSEQIKEESSADIATSIDRLPISEPAANKSIDDSKSAIVSTGWGDLDAIPTPKGAPATPGLAKVIRHKPYGQNPTATQSALLASLHKDKSAVEKIEANSDEAAKTVELDPSAQAEIDEEKAQALLDRLVASSSPPSVFVSESGSLDARMKARIDSWIEEIEKKDKYTQGHALPVSEYALAIGKRLNLTESDLEDLRLAALLHDVGKLGTAASILQRPDEELSDPELITAMNHTLDGAALLQSFEQLAHLAPIVLAHHEEYDGNGYPQGLKGEDIPLAARIIYIANAYHAMVSPTRFGQGASPEKAKEQLLEGKGRQYDPKIVDLFLESNRS